jgi:hypothetical protein
VAKGSTNSGDPFVVVCLFVFTRPAGTSDRLLSNTLPDCIVSTESYMHNIISAGHTLPAEFGPEPTEGSHKSSG